MSVHKGISAAGSASREAHVLDTLMLVCVHRERRNTMPMNHAARMILKALSFDGDRGGGVAPSGGSEASGSDEDFYKTTDERYTTENMKCRCGFSFRTKK